MTNSIKLKVYALILLGVIGGFAALCVAVYNKAFTSTVPVYVRADRTGLQMYPGNRVQLLGVDVGEVGAVALDEGGGTVEITLKMDPDTLDAIPANAGVQLNQLTAFGAKTVGITVPEQPSSVRLAANDTLMTDRVTVEVNTLFDHLDSVLTTLQPDKVSAFLGNMAQALQGRGAQIGETAGELEAYLRRFNENLPDLQRTLASGADLTDLYADIAPDLTHLLDDAAFTSRTVVDQQAQLDSFFYQVTRLSGVGADFFRHNGDDLEEVVRTGLPTTDLLREYSPEFACFIQGMDEGRKRLEKTQGDTVPGLVGNTTFEPGDRAYDGPPVVAATGGPNCNGLPSVDGLSTPPELLRNVDKGGEPNPEPGDNTLRIGDPPLVAQLFGPLAAQGTAQQGGER
ncbi:MCE family protein [Pseudonocardia halophobica]|uniref:Virulence factor Mce family protein n=1 Tax=Pseudonocardia halophobica TaxID=29401 RepID=A0A9W6L6F5_9PSEU|nr:MCE family protein [Pseudonocardia halophobica]GLL12950.1 virulence factor Mce family protein [Pseudonocardia halophobica]